MGSPKALRLVLANVLEAKFWAAVNAGRSFVASALASRDKTTADIDVIRLICNNLRFRGAKGEGNLLAVSATER